MENSRSATGLPKPMLHWAVSRIEQELREGSIDLSKQKQTILIDIADFEFLQSRVETKNCVYQVPEGRDLFCAASHSGDEAQRGNLGIRTLAPTSAPLCLACALPDDGLLCSHLTHPKVEETGVSHRQLMEAKCDRGRPEITTPAACAPGQNKCWERIVRLGPESLPTAYVSPALTRALDYLDLVWRLRFDKISS